MSETEKKKYSLKYISDYIDALIIGDGDLDVDHLSTIEDAKNGSLTFLSNPKYAKKIDHSKTFAIIIKEELKMQGNITQLICDDPYLAYAKVSRLFSSEPNYKTHDFNNIFIHESVELGSNTNIGPNVFIGENCKIGDRTIIYPNTTLFKNVVVGKDCIIHSNSVLGSDGFGFAPKNDGYEKIEQLGKLIIGNDVEIGAGCTIDRGAISNTIISDGSKLDNQIHIAHNVSLGSNSAIAACCAIAGSTKIGKNFKMGGLSGVLGHLEICDDVTVGAHTLITKSIKSSGNYIGIMPAQNHMNWSKSAVFIKKRGK